jgi:hypothetical protein
MPRARTRYALGGNYSSPFFLVGPILAMGRQHIVERLTEIPVMASM